MLTLGVGTASWSPHLLYPLPGIGDEPRHDGRHVGHQALDPRLRAHRLGERALVLDGRGQPHLPLSARVGRKRGKLAVLALRAAKWPRAVGCWRAGYAVHPGRLHTVAAGRVSARGLQQTGKRRCK